MTQAPPIPLPTTWPEQARRGLLDAVALARCAFLKICADFENGGNPRAAMASENERVKSIPRYHYRVTREEEDQLFIARVSEWPSLSAHGATMESALAKLRSVVESCIQDMLANVEDPPEPLT